MAVSGSSTNGFQISGIASGLDTDAIIEQLLNIERIPLNAVDTREAKINTQLTAWRSLNTRVLAFETSTTQLGSEELFQTRTARSSNEEIATVTADTGQDVGVFQLTVESLAVNHQQISQGYTTATDSVGQGTIEIKVGTAVFDPIEIGASQSSLSGIRDAINQADLGVNASILDTGETNGANRYRLVLNSSNSGTAGEMDITFNLNGTKPTLVDLEEPKDAVVKLGTGVNAVTVTSSSNTVTDFIPGVTIDLLKASPGEQIQITLENNEDAVENQIQNFITNYNQMASFFDQQFDYNESDETTGTLFGDFSLLQLQNDLVTATTDRSRNDGEFSSLTQIGINLDSTGRLSITDRDAFDAALKKPKELQKLLNDRDDGVITKVTKVVDATTASSTGLIATKENLINQQLIDIGDKRLSILRSVDRREVLLRTQFTAMERTLSLLQSQSSQLAAQLGTTTTT